MHLSQLEKCKIPLARRGALKAAKAFKPGVDLEGGTRGVTLPEMTCGFLINTVQSLYSYRIYSTIQNLLYHLICILSSSHIYAQSKAFLRFVYVTSYQLCHPLVMHPFLRKILDPPPANPHHVLHKIFPFSTLFKTRDQSYWFIPHTELCTAVEPPSSSNLLLVRALYAAARSQSSKIISTKEFYVKSLLSGHLRDLDESFLIVVISISHPTSP